MSKFINLVKDSIDMNIFLTFTNICNKLELIYVYKENRKIICYDLDDLKKIIEIKLKNEFIYTLKHIFDPFKKRDLIIYLFQDGAKLWDINNAEMLLVINEKAHNICFLRDKTNIYIICRIFINETFVIYNLEGKIIKKINGFSFVIGFLETYYDNKSSFSFITFMQKENRVHGSKIISYSYIQSYDYNKDKIYQKYHNGKGSYKQLLMNYGSENIKLIGLEEKLPNVIIWDFHTGKKLNVINYDLKIHIICLWNEQYLIGGESNNSWNPFFTIKLLDIKNPKNIKDIIKFKKNTYAHISFEKLIHFKYNECLIMSNDNKISLLKINLKNL